uniref:Uncharacterized protein n=1 Tax=viral metagenome TaxID=1070528 RepID=A0A6M3IZA5_9ZZZZ
MAEEKGMWDSFISALSGAPQKAQQMQSGAPLEEGETDWNMWTSIFGRAAQALSAQDPNSWQYQFGKLGSELGRTGKMAQVEERGKKERDLLTKALYKAFGINVEDQGGGGSALGDTQALSGLGSLEDKAPWSLQELLSRGGEY